MKTSEIRIRCTPEFLAEVHKARGRESITSWVTWCIEQEMKRQEDERNGFEYVVRSKVTS